MIEVLMQVRKDKYKDNLILPEGLDLVEENEQITHQIQKPPTKEVFTLPPLIRAESEESERSLRTPLGLNLDFFWVKVLPIWKF